MDTRGAALTLTLFTEVIRTKGFQLCRFEDVTVSRVRASPLVLAFSLYMLQQPTTINFVPNKDAKSAALIVTNRGNWFTDPTMRSDRSIR